jgi:putative Mg2+ transporter-C (MgtC) family protein
MRWAESLTSFYSLGLVLAACESRPPVFLEALPTRFGWLDFSNQTLPLRMRTVGFEDVLLRLAMAFIAGFAIGCERESRGRAAGLRTNILACVAAAIAMIISEELFGRSTLTPISGGAWRPDPARLGAGVLTGIGFLGAGTIMRNDSAIRGVTTAASLWFVTIIGLAFGSGLIALGWTGFAVAMTTLFVLPRLETHIQSHWYGTLQVTVGLEGISERQLRDKLNSGGAEVKNLKLVVDVANAEKSYIYAVKYNRNDEIAVGTRFIEDISRCPGVKKVSWT